MNCVCFWVMKIFGSPDDEFVQLEHWIHWMAPASFPFSHTPPKTIRMGAKQLVYYCDKIITIFCVNQRDSASVDLIRRRHRIKPSKRHGKWRITNSNHIQVCSAKRAICVSVSLCESVNAQAAVNKFYFDKEISSIKDEFYPHIRFSGFAQCWTASDIIVLTVFGKYSCLRSCLSAPPLTIRHFCAAACCCRSLRCRPAPLGTETAGGRWGETETTEHTSIHNLYELGCSKHLLL